MNYCNIRKSIAFHRALSAALGLLAMLSLISCMGSTPAVSVSGDATINTTNPIISSISPNYGTVGTTVLISGSNFLTGAQVYFGSVAATSVSVVSANQITVDAPAGTLGSVVTLTVENVGGYTGTYSAGFTYGTSASVVTSTTGTGTGTGTVVTSSDPPPVISTLSPTAYWPQGGATDVITGTNFLPGAVVYFGSIPISAANTNVVSSTEIDVVIPANTPGYVAVEVLNSDGNSATLPNAFEYLTPVSGGVSINANGGGNQYLYTDQSVNIYWNSSNEISCRINAANFSSPIASGLNGSIPAPAGDCANDDTYQANCLNESGGVDSNSVSVYRLAHAVGGPNYASYVLATEQDAVNCAKRIAAASNACAQDVRIGATRDVINQGGINFDDPASCRCDPGAAAGYYSWY